MIENTKSNKFYDIQKRAKEYFKDVEAKYMQRRADRFKGYSTESKKEFEGGYFRYKRLEWFMKSRLNPDGEVFNFSAKIFDEFLKEEHLLKNTNSQSKQLSVNGSWAPIGSTNYTSGIMGNNGGIGRVNCIAFHPTNASTFWIGTPAGGLWKTNNNGNSWTPLTDGIPNLGVSGICISPTNTNTIYLLCGDGDGAFKGFSGNFSIGVIKSTNGGVTWKSTGLAFNITDMVLGYKLLMHPSNSNILFAITNTGIFKTVNGGSTWINVKSGSFFDAEFKPGNPSIMYAVEKNTFLKSTNTGDSWSVVSSGLPSPAPQSNRMTVAVTPANPDVVYTAYAGDESQNGFLGLFKSMNSGQSFSKMSDSPNLMGREQGLDSASQSQYDFTLGVDLTDESVVYLGGIDLWKSDDNGVNWSIITHWFEPFNTIGYNHADQHALEINPLNNRIYTGTDGGIYYSSDNGDNWNNITIGLQISQLYKIADHDPDPDLLFFGTQDNGSNKLSNGSLTMEHLLGGDGMECIISPTNSSLIYASQQEGKIWKSGTGGALFTPWGPLDVTGGEWVTPYIMDPFDDDVLYIGYDTIWKTTDGGSNFNNVLVTSGDNFVAMAMGTSVIRRIYACKPNSIVMSSDTGFSWTTITGSLPVGNSSISNICVSTTNSAKAWVTFSGFTSGIKVFETTNAGGSWTNISGSLPNIPVNCISVEPGTSADALYIGTDLGVYYRDDNIGDWVPFKNGLPNVIVNDLEINIGANKIRAATFGRGIWESDLFNSCPTDYNLTAANNPGSGCFQHYNANNSITSSRAYLSGLGCDILYNAGGHIDLLPGFEVRSEGTFWGYIDGCNNIAASQVSLIPHSGTYEGEMDPEPEISEEEINTRLDIINDLLVYPNPFTNSTTFAFKMESPGIVSISITDITGRIIETFIDNVQLPEGNQLFRYETGHLSGGVYLLMITTDKNRVVKTISKM
jgi:hypothetical protein